MERGWGRNYTYEPTCPNGHKNPHYDPARTKQDYYRQFDPDIHMWTPDCGMSYEDFEDYQRNKQMSLTKIDDF